MRDIKSFTIDHINMERGIYVSRVDRVGFHSVTTFDVRMKKPYADEPLNPATAHTLEHCLATYLRNHRSDILYVGPMGCMTGFYVMVKGRKRIEDIRRSLVGAFSWVLNTNTIPGETKQQCGNYTFMDLGDARREAASFLVVISE